jgi:hypothetical protein
VVVQSWPSDETKSRRVDSSTGDISGGRRDGGGRTASEARSQQRPGATGPALEEALFKVDLRRTRSNKDERATGRERAEQLLSGFLSVKTQLAHQVARRHQPLISVVDGLVDSRGYGATSLVGARRGGVGGGEESDGTRWNGGGRGGTVAVSQWKVLEWREKGV